MTNFYTKKPVTIEAIIFTGSLENYEELKNFLGEDLIGVSKAKCIGSLWTAAIKTLEGVITATEGDYIIKGVKGEFYPCKPDIFKLTYDVAES